MIHPKVDSKREKKEHRSSAKNPSMSVITSIFKPQYINNCIVHERIETSASNQHGAIRIRYALSPESTKEWTK